MSRPKIVVAAKILVYINGKLFGRCTSFSWSSVTQRKELETIDVEIPAELMSTRVRTAWSMGVLRTIGDGGLQGAGVASQQSDLSREKYFTIQLIERTSGLTIFRSDNNNTDSEQWSVNAKGMLIGTASGKSITWVNETAT